MALGNQHARKSFRVPANGGGKLEELEAQCARVGHLPSGPAKHRTCGRCGVGIPLPSLAEISARMREIGEMVGHDHIAVLDSNSRVSNGIEL